MNKAQQASVELRAMDELAAQDSPMHRLSPLSKLFVTVLYIVVTVSFHKYDISGVFVMVLFPLVGYQVGMIPVHTCFHKLRVVMPLVCAVGLFNPFFDKRIVLYIGAVGVSGGVISMLTLMMKGIFCLMRRSCSRRRRASRISAARCGSCTCRRCSRRCCCSHSGISPCCSTRRPS